MKHGQYKTKMRPYETIRLIEWPDVVDCRIQGRKFSAGGKNYGSTELKKTSRRILKRKDKGRMKIIMMKEISEMEDNYVL